MATVVTHVQEKTTSPLRDQLKVILWMGRKKKTSPPASLAAFFPLWKRLAVHHWKRLPHTHIKFKTHSRRWRKPWFKPPMRALMMQFLRQIIYGIIIDETVNVTIDKKLIIYLSIWELKNEQPMTVFLGSFTVCNGTVETITTTVRQTLTARGIDFASLQAGIQWCLCHDQATQWGRCQAVTGEQPVSHPHPLCMLQDASKAEVGAEVQKTLQTVFTNFISIPPLAVSAWKNLILCWVMMTLPVWCSHAQSAGFVFRGQWIHSAISGQQSSWN